MMGIDETKVDAMTRDELYEKLKPLAMALQNDLISKQHAFNTNRNFVDECKSNGINNKLMVEAINSHLPDNDQITIIYFKNLLSRSKQKSGQNNLKTVKSAEQNSSGTVKNPLNKLSGLSKPQSTEYNPTPDKSRIYGDDNE